MVIRKIVENHEKHPYDLLGCGCLTLMAVPSLISLGLLTTCEYIEYNYLNQPQAGHELVVPAEENPLNRADTIDGSYGLSDGEFSYDACLPGGLELELDQ